MPSDETHGSPGSDASYGAILKHWMKILGVRGSDLAEDLGLHPSYPGKIQRGEKVPSTETADSIRKQLVKKGRENGPTGRPRLVAAELQQMDDELRTSFTRADDARRGARPAETQTPNEDRKGDEPTVLQPIALEPATLPTRPPLARTRGRMSLLATIGLIALALLLTFGGVVYYMTHASPPRTVNTPGQPYTPQQLRHAVTTSQHQVYDDSLTAPGAHGWDTGPKPGGDCHFQSDGYHATALTTEIVECFPESAPPLSSSGTVAVQVDLTFRHGDGGAGLVLCYAGLNAPYYRFVVQPSGHFDFFDPVTRTYPVTTAVPVLPDAQYQLTAIVRATGVYLYINGVFVASGAGERQVSLAGQVGIFTVHGVHNPTDVVFHNFTVWDLPALR